MKSFFSLSLLALALAFGLPTDTTAQNRVLNKFYRQHKKGKAVQNMKLPGWLIRFGGKIAVKSEDMSQDEQEIARELIKKVGTMRMLYSEDGSQIPKKDVEQLRRDLEGINFEKLIYIKSGEVDFDLMIQEKDGVIQNIFMLYNNLEDGEMAMFSLKTSFSLDEVKALLEKEMEENYHDIMEGEDVAPIVVPVL